MNGLNSLTALGQMNKVPLDMTLEGMRAFGETQQADRIGLQELMRKQQFEQQMDPMRLQQAQTSNDIGLQDLYGRKRANKEADFTSDVRMQAEYKGFLQKASDSDVAMATNKWQEMAFHPNPKISAQGQAGLAMTKEFLLAKQGQDNNVKTTGMNNAAAIRVAEINAEARKNAGSGSGSKVKTLEQAIDNAKSAKERHQMLIDAATMAQQAGNTELAEQYAYRAERLRPQAERELAAGDAKPGGVDIRGVTDGRVPTNPTLPIAPGGANKPIAKTFTIDQLKSRYPGVDEKKLREAAKAKGIEIK